MKLLIAVTVIFLILNGTNACLIVAGSFNSGCVSGNGHLRLTDNNVIVCDGSCTHYNSCSPPCKSGYSATVSNDFRHLAYSTPHGSYTASMTPDEGGTSCCILSPDGACSLTAWQSTLNAKLFGC